MQHGKREFGSNTIIALGFVIVKSHGINVLVQCPLHNT